MARNACLETGRAELNAVSAYRKQSKEDMKHRDETKHKLSLKGKCCKCGVEINLYTRYRSGKMNKDAFVSCLECFRTERDKPEKKGGGTSFIESLSSFQRDRSETL